MFSFAKKNFNFSDRKCIKVVKLFGLAIGRIVELFDKKPTLSWFHYMKFYQSTLKNDLGIITLTFSDEGLHTIFLNENKGNIVFELSKENQYLKQLKEYFAGNRKQFDLPLVLIGTPFQTKVWEYIQHIPYGETQTYNEVAQGIGHPNGQRAVGNALHANPIPIVFPCHRVIRSDGGLGGFGLGIDVKQKLLDLERQHL